jgi:AcrR family transcriptional regulator
LSQGAFYYYFESKMEILIALVDRILGEELQKTLDELVERDDMDAIEKIMQLNRYFTDQARRSREFVGFLHEERNAHLHLKIEQKMFPLVVPPTTRLIEQGVAEGVFNTQYPREAAVALLGAAEALNKIRPEPEEWGKVIEFAFDLAERVLGARPPSSSSSSS